MLSLILPLLLACTGAPPPAPPTADAPVRNAGDIVVLGGELKLDSAWDDIFRDGHAASAEARIPLTRVHGALKGGVHSDASLTLVPLGSSIAADDCKGVGCPGRADLTHALAGAGIDAVSLTSSVVLRQNQSQATADGLAAHGICATGHGQAPACVRTVGDSRVALTALAALSSDEAKTAPERAKALVDAARSGADVVVLHVALPAGPDKRDARDQRLRAIAADAGANVVVGHFDGSFGGVSQIGSTLVLHNPGGLLSRELPPAGLELSWIWRLHLVDGKLAWADGTPVVLEAGRSRLADGAAQKKAVLLLRRRSDAPGLVFEGRTPIVELR